MFAFTSVFFGDEDLSTPSNSLLVQSCGSAQPRLGRAVHWTSIYRLGSAAGCAAWLRLADRRLPKLPRRFLHL